MIVLVAGRLRDHYVRVLHDEIVAGSHIEFQSLRRPAHTIGSGRLVII